MKSSKLITTGLFVFLLSLTGCNNDSTPVDTNVYPESITLSKHEVNLFMDDEEPTILTVTIEPEEYTIGEMTWSATNGYQSICTIEEGEENTFSITPVALGEVVLTVSINGKNETLTDSCTIKVVEKVYAESVSFAAKSAYVFLSLGDDFKSVTVIPHVLPENFNNAPIEWATFEYPKVHGEKVADFAFSEDGKTCTVTGVGLGQCTVRALVYTKTSEVYALININVYDRYITATKVALPTGTTHVPKCTMGKEYSTPYEVTPTNATEPMHLYFEHDTGYMAEAYLKDNKAYYVGYCEGECEMDIFASEDPENDNPGNKDYNVQKRAWVTMTFSPSFTTTIDNNYETYKSNFTGHNKKAGEFTVVKVTFKNDVTATSEHPVHFEIYPASTGIDLDVASTTVKMRLPNSREYIAEGSEGLCTLDVTNYEFKAGEYVYLEVDNVTAFGGSKMYMSVTTSK